VALHLVGQSLSLRPVSSVSSPADSAATEQPAPAEPAVPGVYRADVLRVVDGDTVEMRVHVWIGQEIRTLVRLRGIDTPELQGRCPSERRAAEVARDRLQALLAAGPVRLASPSADKYFGRVLAELKLGDGRDAAAVLLAENLARPYHGTARQGWCGEP
jgi:endonuclease YncB( thermonuclease family)